MDRRLLAASGAASDLHPSWLGDVQGRRLSNFRDISRSIGSLTCIRGAMSVEARQLLLPVGGVDGGIEVDGVGFERFPK
jgi:hypothetical protein